MDRRPLSVQRFVDFAGAQGPKGTVGSTREPQLLVLTNALKNLIWGAKVNAKQQQNNNCMHLHEKVPRGFDLNGFHLLLCLSGNAVSG